MGVVHCGETPSADCGSYSAASSSTNFKFTTSNGNPILVNAKGVHGVCYGYYNASNDPYGLIAYQLASTRGSGWNSGSYTLYPLHFEAKGRADVSYNSNGELIVTLNDVVSTLTGTDGDSGREFRAKYYPGGDTAIAMNVKLITAGNASAPAEGDGGWNKCIGGWWGAAQYCAAGDCYAGGTLYWWNSWNRFGTPYEHHGNTPTRRNNGLSWNLGHVQNNQTQLIAIYARAARGSCGSAHFSSQDGGVQQCVLISIPPMNICPPEINGLEHERDICEETINTVVNITTPTLGTDGVNLVIMYEAINSEDDWSDSKAATQTVINVAEDSTFDVTINEHLIPNTNYFFKFYLEKDGRKSEEIMVCDQWTPYMPSATCLVPLLTEEECETLSSGDCLDELTAETAEECC